MPPSNQRHKREPAQLSVKPGDELDPSWYNSQKRTFVRIAHPCVVLEVKHAVETKWTTVLLKMENGSERWIGMVWFKR